MINRRTFFGGIIASALALVFRPFAKAQVNNKSLDKIEVNDILKGLESVKKYVTLETTPAIYPYIDLSDGETGKVKYSFTYIDGETTKVNKIFIGGDYSINGVDLVLVNGDRIRVTNQGSWFKYKLAPDHWVHFKSIDEPHFETK